MTRQILVAFARLQVGDAFCPVGLLPFIPNARRGHVIARDLGAYIERVSRGRYHKIAEVPAASSTAAATLTCGSATR